MAISGAVIAIDFDGTVVTHEYPNIGEDAGATEVLKELVRNRNKLILYTMRSGKLLDAAKSWFAERKFRCSPSMRTPSRADGPSRRRSMPISISTTATWAVRSRSSTAVRAPVADWVKIREQLVRDGYLDE